MSEPQKGEDDAGKTEETVAASTDDTPEPVQDNVVEDSPEVEVVEVIEMVVEPTVEETLRAKNEELLGRLREVSKAYKDRDSEMEAFRKRQQGNAVLVAEQKVFTVVKAFFDPIQNLKRSVEAGGDDPVAILEGLKMVQQQFQTAMAKLGLEEVPGVGSEFDVSLHEALAIMPVTEAEQDGKVMVVHTTGYTLRGKTLQAAQVVIGKYTEPAEA